MERYLYPGIVVFEALERITRQESTICYYLRNHTQSVALFHKTKDAMIDKRFSTSKLNLFSAVTCKIGERTKELGQSNLL
jgi:hypothetical protein